MSALRVVITGLTGRMGRTLARLVAESTDLVLVGATERPGSAALGSDVGLAVGLPARGALISDSLGSVLAAAQAQVVIDFTGPEASLTHARSCADAGVALVIGTTGFTPEAKAELGALARRIPLVVAPNMSVGVNLLLEVAAHLAQVLGEGYDVEILEAHHRMKKDAPSGTALKLAEEIALATGRSREDFQLAREGQVGVRPRGEIGIQALRGGDVVGEHTVFFYGDGERVELTHRATSRDTFAAGALRAARWLTVQKPGLYDMQDVLGLSRRAMNPVP